MGGRSAAPSRPLTARAMTVVWRACGLWAHADSRRRSPARQTAPPACAKRWRPWGRGRSGCAGGATRGSIWISKSRRRPGPRAKPWWPPCEMRRRLRKASAGGSTGSTRLRAPCRQHGGAERKMPRPVSTPSRSQRASARMGARRPGRHAPAKRNDGAPKCSRTGGMRRGYAHGALPCSGASVSVGGRRRSVRLHHTRCGPDGSPEVWTIPWCLWRSSLGSSPPGEAPRLRANFYRKKRTCPSRPTNGGSPGPPAGHGGAGAPRGPPGAAAAAPRWGKHGTSARPWCGAQGGPRKAMACEYFCSKLKNKIPTRRVARNMILPLSPQSTTRSSPLLRAST